MHALGVTKVQDRLQWALLKLGKVERTGEDSSIPPEILSIKNLNIVTGLEGFSVLRRDLTLPLTKTPLQALPFQLEPMLPFPLDQSVVYPQLYFSKKETFVVAWITTFSSVQNHLEVWQTIDPDFISIETLALARYVRHFFPNQQIVALKGTLGIAIDGERVLCAMESQDPDRLKVFLKQKYPHFTWVDQEMPFAIAIGLGLEIFQAHPCQLRPTNIPSSRQKKRHRWLMQIAVIAGACFMLVTTSVSLGALHYQETKLKNQMLGFSDVNSFRSFVMQQAKQAPPVFNFPSTKEVLSWLSTLETPVDITHLEYELITPHSAQVSLEFQAAAPSVAEHFIKQLQQVPTLVKPTHELKWTSHSQGYKICFQLQSL